MHSSRMRTVRSSSRLLGGGLSGPGGTCSRDVPALGGRVPTLGKGSAPKGVPAPGKGICSQGVCLLQGVCSGGGVHPSMH